MFTQTTKHSFIEAFRSSDTYKDNFSYEGLEALYDYITQYEDDTGTTIQFDMVAICCEYSEYQTIKEAFIQYNSAEAYDELCELNEWDNEDIVEEIRNEDALEYLQNNTSVITIEGADRIIIADF